MFGYHYRLERKALWLILGDHFLSLASAASWKSLRFSPSTRRWRRHRTCRVYTPLELPDATSTSAKAATPAIRQMIRTFRAEVERYGPYSLAVESHTTVRSSGDEATGPDLQESAGATPTNGIRASHNPRDVVPESSHAGTIRGCYRNDSA